MPAESQGTSLTRREMFGRFFQPFRAAAQPETFPAPVALPTEMIAVIAGRHCLAYQGTGCTVCVERCPVNGALKLEQGLPRVVADVCTGCRVCHEVCPAPQNAVRLVPRPPGMAKLTNSANSSPPGAPSPFPHLPDGGISRV